MEQTMIENVKSLDSYQASREAIFPTTQSLLWFCRVNKAELYSRGIMLKILNRKMVDEEAMDAFVLEVGSRRAA
jgi:hypothetical protein